ncbi:hypothetical protein D9758_017548 [Tetrapyrgos nigripes]|uniref:DNA 3'-5' helicase n=1 Tax=Tetrapyrgos nigripes TaxID=182062 RepID=A0A8H5FGG8_9AGAR|nr:hypothetical protein D9758_017548 [Tetrapyrgos nigripes]
MSETYRWQSSEGQALLNNIIRKRVPQWTDGLKDGQSKVVTRILDGEKVLWIAATGEGKSAAFQVPVLVHEELRRDPELCPGFVAKEKPIGIVVTPTKGLATNIVHELSKLSIPTYAYTRENVADDIIKGIDVVQDIANCNPTFRSNIIFACTEEAHLIDEWGNPDFRPDFRYIGTYFHSHLPSNISLFALSATIEPGKSTMMICHHLGFREGSFHLIRGSNERPNMQFIVEPLTHGVGGEVFPQLLPYLASGRKTIIHCQTLEAIYRVFVYLISFLDLTSESLNRIRVYHSLCSDKYNADTLDMLENDPNCQIVIATVAFANGINVRTLLDSISLGLASSLNIIMQEKGRVGRNPESLARGVILVSLTAIKNAEKYIEAINANTTPPSSMNHAIALVLTEKICYIVCINKIYQNPPLELASLDCLTAKRRVPCSLCTVRGQINFTFDSSPIASPFPSAPPSVNKSKSLKTLQLKKKTEYARVDLVLSQFSTVLLSFLDKIFYFPDIVSLTDLLHSYSWLFCDAYVQQLYDIILSQLILIKDERRAQHIRDQARKKRKRRMDSDLDKDEDNVDDSSEVNEGVEQQDHESSIPVDAIPLHLTQTDSPNKPSRPKPRPRPKSKALESSKSVMESYGPQRTKRSKVDTAGVEYGNDVKVETGMGIRRSNRLRGPVL